MDFEMCVCVCMKDFWKDSLETLLAWLPLGTRIVMLLLVSHSVSRDWLFVTPWAAARQPGFPVLHHLLELAQAHVHWVGDTILVLCCPLLLLPSVFFPATGSFLKSQFFASGGQSIWSFSFSFSPSSEYSGLISFRMDCLDLFVAQETLKSLLQHHSLKASFLWHSAFFMVASIHDHWKNHSFDYVDLCWQCLCFLICCLGLSWLFFQGTRVL